MPASDSPDSIVMYKVFFDSQGAGVFVVDSATGAILNTNSAAMSMLEMPVTAVIGKLFSNFLRSADGRPLLSSDEAVHGNLKIYKGRKIPVVISTVSCSIEKQKRFIHAFIKVEIKDTEKEAYSTDSEDKFKAITESTQDAIITMDNEKRISFVNSTACRMFGYSAEEMMGEDLHELIAPDKYSDSFRKGFESFRNSGEGIVLGRTIEIEARRKNGNLFPVELTVSSIKHHDGWHAIGLIRDISERRSTEEKIIEASEAAENASRTKSEFLANMSHEIRTPLNSIIGTIDLLSDTKLNDEQEYFIEFIRSSGNNLLALVNNILDMSRIEAGKITLDTIPFNLRNCLNKVVDTLVPRAEKKGLSLSSEINSNVPECLKGDPSRLQQIIINLVGNSIKFTESGSIKVFAENIDTSEEKVVIRFSVVDTGIGIPPSKFESIFNSFSQVDLSVTRKFGGTGLGLTISKNLVNLMNGDITVDSQLDQGSTFSFTAEFGIHQESFDKKGSKTASDEPGKKPAGIMRDLRILLVDDSPDNRFLVKAFLRKEPCLIVEAENGSEALEKYLLKNWDVILMDMQMPIMDGYTATARIRELEREKGLRHIPVVALTAHTINTEIMRCLDAGCDVHLAKPVAKKALIKLISEVTDNLTFQEIEESDAPEKQKKNGKTEVTVDPELIKLIPDYITHRHEDIVKLKTMLKKRQYRDIEKCGHSMKGSGSGYGFDEISKIGSFIERAGHKESIRRIDEGIKKLEQYLETLK